MAFCPKCGNEINPASKFCSACGNPNPQQPAPQTNHQQQSAGNMYDNQQSAFTPALSQPGKRPILGGDQEKKPPGCWKVGCIVVLVLIGIGATRLLISYLFLSNTTKTVVKAAITAGQSGSCPSMFDAVPAEKYHKKDPSLIFEDVGSYYGSLVMQIQQHSSQEAISQGSDHCQAMVESYDVTFACLDNAYKDLEAAYSHCLEHPKASGNKQLCGDLLEKKRKPIEDIDNSLQQFSGEMQRLCNH